MADEVGIAALDSSIKQLRNQISHLEQEIEKKKERIQAYEEMKIRLGYVPLIDTTRPADLRRMNRRVR